MSTSSNTPNRGGTYAPHRAEPVGAYVATAGVLIYVISVFLAWIETKGNKFSGYETDTVVPVLAYFGIGLAAALMYALKRATRRQHRGLSLTSMAAGLAATGLALSYIIETPGGAERSASTDVQFGVWVALVGAVVWAVGSFLLAQEPEGDVEHEDGRGSGRAGTTRKIA